MAGTECYLVRETALTRAAAERDCWVIGAALGRAGKGHLAAPHSGDIQRTLEEVATAFRKPRTFQEQELLADFWLAGEEESSLFGGSDAPVWRWLPGMGYVGKSQFCFTGEEHVVDKIDFCITKWQFCR